MVYIAPQIPVPAPANEGNLCKALKDRTASKDYE